MVKTLVPPAQQCEKCRVRLPSGHTVASRGTQDHTPHLPSSRALSSSYKQVPLAPDFMSRIILGMRIEGTILISSTEL